MDKTAQYKWPALTAILLIITGGVGTKLYMDKTQELFGLSEIVADYREQKIALENELIAKEATISSLLAVTEKLSEAKVNRQLNLVVDTLQKIRIVKEKSEKYKTSGVKVESVINEYPRILDQLTDLKFSEASNSADKLSTELEKLYSAKLEADRKAAEEAKKRFESVVNGTGYTRYNVVTQAGVFNADIITADLNKVKVMTDSAVNSECKADCALQAVGGFVSRLGGFAGINGTYFCPADYPQCSGKKGSFDFPIYNSRLSRWINKDNLFWDNRALITFNGNTGQMYTFAKGFDKGSGVDAAITMTPGLLKDGNVIVGNYKLEAKEKIRSTRSSVGFSGSRVYLIVARGVTNFELAYVHKAVGSKNALALDGGGSVGLFYNGSYLAGPGRAPANAIILRNR